jgi:hypothetical protein
MDKEEGEAINYLIWPTLFWVDGREKHSSFSKGGEYFSILPMKIHQNPTISPPTHTQGSCRPREKAKRWGEEAIVV